MTGRHIFCGHQQFAYCLDGTQSNIHNNAVKFFMHVKSAHVNILQYILTLPLTTRSLQATRVFHVSCCISETHARHPLSEQQEVGMGLLECPLSLPPWRLTIAVRASSDFTQKPLIVRPPRCALAGTR